MRRPTQLRPFHARASVDPEFPLAPLSSDPDYSSSSEQSCDTVIYIGPNGTALSDKELTDNEGPPDFVPIVPALQKTRGDSRPVEATEAAANKSERDCLKCNTFAELQERLDCIDGSEEPNKFPFEELPIQFGPEQAGRCVSLSQAAGPDTLSESDKEDNGSDNGQLTTDRESTELPASKVQQRRSPVPTVTRSGSPSPASPRSIPGSSSQHSTSQLTQSPSLQSSRESLNSCGFVEGKPRPMGSPRLGVASLSKTSEYKPPSSPSQRCKVYTQKGVLPSSAPPPSLSKDSGMASSESLLQPDVRTPPVGMSPQVLKKSMSAGSEGFSGTLVEDGHQDSKKEILSTTMVTVQQPLELNGEDELVFTLVEELTISGVLDSGRPTSIISFNSDCSVQALASGSRPVSIISSISEDLECYSSMAPVSEVSITQFLPLPKLGLDEKTREAGSQRSSISSWLSEMSTGSDGEQSCHSFIAQTCFGHGEAMAEPPAAEFVNTIQNTAVVCREKPEVGPDNLLILSETGEESVNKATPVKGCKISTLGKAMVTISNTANLSSCEGYIPMKTNITVYPCIAMSPRNVQESESSTATPKEATKTAQPQESKEASARREMKFEDPWLKREEEVKKESAYPGEEGLRGEAVTSSLTTEGKSEQEPNGRPSSGDRLSSSSSGEASTLQVTDNIRRVVDGCEMALPGLGAQSPIHSNKNLKSSSLPRAFQKADRHEALDSFYHCLADSNGFSGALGIHSSKTTLERKVASPKHCVLARPKGTPPLPPVRKSSLDQKNRASPQHSGSSSSSTGSPLNQPATFLACFPDESNSKTKDASSSSKLFSAKLEQLASRTNSLGRTTVSHYECLSLERAESLSSVSSRMHAGKDSTMPRTGRSLGRSTGASPPSCGITQPAGASPKASQSKISAVSKLLLASPKSRSLSTSTTKTLSFSTKSLPQSVGQSSNLPPSGKHMSWSTQSLSRSRGSGLASKLPLRAVNGRISELLQGSASPRGAQLRAEAEERSGAPTEDKPAAAHLLPSPYSKITPPRKPHRCSSGHGSDNSSVLSGELPPAMGKTALFYHSGGSSGYESMMRDSEATGSASSAQDSMSENSSSVGGRCRTLKTPKKRSNSGRHQTWARRTEASGFWDGSKGHLPCF